MFDTFDGLPLHPLVVHGVAVLLPLAVLGAIALLIRPSWRARYGWLFVGVTAVGTLLVPIATKSGEELQNRVGDPGQHADLGNQLIWFALALLAAEVTWVVLGRRSKPEAPAANPSRSASSSTVAITWLVAGVTLVAAVAAGIQVYRVGETGARTSWGGLVQQG